MCHSESSSLIDTMSYLDGTNTRDEKGTVDQTSRKPALIKSYGAREKGVYTFNQNPLHTSCKPM